MKQIEAPCPACGAPVEFRVSSSLVTVCAYCHSVVARGDRELKDLGKVAALVETDSPLELGLTGKFRDKPFEIVGHVQYRHAAGGVWDEWYAAFPGDRWGWIAEAQGRIYLTFRAKKSQATALPDADMLLVGAQLDLGEAGTLVVQEIGTATLIAAAGELPYEPEPGKPHRYADLSGTGQRFGTVDLDAAPPQLFLGNQVTLAALGISLTASSDREPKEISGKLLACPQCGGSLDLKAPEQSERVVCPFCSALLDVNHGNLEYLKTLEQRTVKPLIELGTVGTLRGREFTVIGFMQRSVNVEGKDYYWTEYLLYHARDGFFWLVNSDSHWNFVEPVPVGELQRQESRVTFRGETYKLYQNAMATVRFVLGEFYWKVEIGEVVEAIDYIAPPHMLSIETSGMLQDAKEVNVSLGSYVPITELLVAFPKAKLQLGWGVAPNQPNPVDTNVYWLWVAMVLVLIGVDVVFSQIRSTTGVDQTFFMIAVVLISLYPLGVFMYGQDFEKRRWADSDYSPYESNG